MRYYEGNPALKAVLDAISGGASRPTSRTVTGRWSTRCCGAATTTCCWPTTTPTSKTQLRVDALYSHREAWAREGDRQRRRHGRLLFRPHDREYARQDLEHRACKLPPRHGYDRRHEPSACRTCLHVADPHRHRPDPPAARHGDPFAVLGAHADAQRPASGCAASCPGGPGGGRAPTASRCRVLTRCCTQDGVFEACMLGSTAARLPAAA